MTRRAPTRREIAWALLVSAILVSGIVGTLLLQTAMQGQARNLLQAHGRAAALAQHDRSLHRALAQAADPATLATHARALHMHPQVTPHFVDRRHRSRGRVAAAGRVEIRSRGAGSRGRAG
jgi:hypothetical protein